MKKVLFGIALILFAVVLLLSGIWLPVISDLMDRTEFAVLVAAIGLVYGFQESGTSWVRKNLLC